MFKTAFDGIKLTKEVQLINGCQFFKKKIIVAYNLNYKT